MALNFIKKVFSFGRNKEDAPAPDAEDRTGPRETDADAATDAGQQAFPQEAAPGFTPETAPDERTISTPEPETEENAGEPPIGRSDLGAETSETRIEDSAGPQDHVMPEDLVSDPVSQITPEPDAEPVPAPAPESAPGLP